MGRGRGRGTGQGPGPHRSSLGASPAPAPHSDRGPALSAPHSNPLQPSLQGSRTYSPAHLDRDRRSGASRQQGQSWAHEQRAAVIAAPGAASSPPRPRARPGRGGATWALAAGAGLGRGARCPRGQTAGLGAGRGEGRQGEGPGAPRREASFPAGLCQLSRS